MPAFKGNGEKCDHVNLDEVGNKSLGILMHQRRALHVLTSAMFMGTDSFCYGKERCLAQ